MAKARKDGVATDAPTDANELEPPDEEDSEVEPEQGPFLRALYRHADAACTEYGQSLDQ
jgi:hypothetical protein